MKKSLILVCLSISTTVLLAQNVTDKKEKVQKTILADDERDLPVFTSEETAQTLIASIMDVLGLEPNFKIKTANIPNVEADIRRRQRYILYNPEFINQVNKASENKWPSIFILAHEIGHHLNGHTIIGKSSTPSIELEADQFAGFVLYKMGATLEEAQLAMYIIANKTASKTHPARADRLTAIEKGWNKAVQL